MYDDDKCEDCRYWACSDDMKEGMCLYGPPAVAESGHGTFPVVASDFWCGRYRSATPTPLRRNPPCSESR